VPPLQLTVGHLARPRLGLPAIPAVNCYLEKTPGGPTGNVLSSRPGLTQAYNVGSGPILRTFQKPGFFNGDVFNVSQGVLYRNSTSLGTVSYSDAPRFAAAQTQMAMVSGGALYIYDGTTLKLQTTFDDGVSVLPPFSSVAVLYSVYVYSVQGSNQFFFSKPGSPAVINAANYSAAQTTPTPIVEIGVLGEELYFFKPDVTEIWDYTGQLTAPFAESPGRTYARGCAAQASVCQLDNALFWVGDNYSVYRTGSVPEKVSTGLIDDRLLATAQTAQPHAFTALNFAYEGHDYYVLNLPNIGQAGESYAYDCQTQQWFRWGTEQPGEPDPGLWLGQTASGQGSQIYIGSSVDGRVFQPDATSHKDDTTPMRVMIGGARWFGEGVERCNNLTLWMVRGIATSSVPLPLVAMCYSDDGGRTFSTWQYGSVGGVGGYRYKASWHSLGLMRQPGREFVFAITDAVNVTVEGAAINPPRR
jgi:hypothetical protein